jgi:hypothetical protein
MSRPFALALAAVAIALIAPGVASAQTPPEGFVWRVLEGLNDLHDDPEDPTSGPPIVTTVPDGVIKAVDINHDGQTDWLIDWPEATSVCGTGGCLKSLYVSGPDGFTRALDRQVLEFDIRTVGDETRIEAMVHHGECPTQEAKGDWDCRYAWAWDERARALIPRPTRAGVALLDGAGSPPVAAGQHARRRCGPVGRGPGRLSGRLDRERLLRQPSRHQPAARRGRRRRFRLVGGPAPGLRFGRIPREDPDMAHGRGQCRHPDL